MNTLSAISYNNVKSLLPESFLTKCGQLKKNFLAAERDKLHIDFLNKCIDNEVIPKHLLETIPKSHRNVTKFNNKHSDTINQSITERIESCALSEEELSNGMRCLTVSDKKIATVVIEHFAKREIIKIKVKLVIN